jgi:outer membrane cobalamin receptor
MMYGKQPFALTAFSLLALAAPVHAQEAGEEETARTSDIIVTAPRLRGSVDVDITPDLILDAAAIDSYGASSVTDLLAALSTQTRSGRGRGGGQPVVLVNGKRVSGFAEIRDLPSEAIQRVEVLPEDVALRYGFTADQRVINFILKDNFSAFTGEVEYGGPTAGGRGEAEVQATWLNITKTGRINLSAQYDRDGSILERERGIRFTGVDETAFRTLLPKNEALGLNGIINRSVAGDVSATLNLRHDRADTQALFGLPLVGADPLERNVRSRSVNAGLTLDGKFGRWNWTATANQDQARVRTLTDQRSGAPAQDQAQSKFTTTNAQYSLTGPLVQLPAGAVTLNIRAGFDRRRIKSVVARSTALMQSRISRSDANARANIDIPLTDRRRSVGAALGDLSINLNGGYKRLSDFGAITAYGYGLNWSPISGLSVLASFAAEEAAPSPQQLGDPRILTPNAVAFDFSRGQTVFVDQITGGNPLLRAEERRDVKLGISYSPPALSALNISANYFRNRSTNPIASFPALTLDTERAFLGRVVRSAGGQLISIDQRAVNFLSSQSDQLRWGISFSKEFGQPPQRPGGDGGRSGGGERSGQGGGGRPDGAGAAGPPRSPGGFGGRGGGGGGFGRFGGGQGGRWSVSLFHTIKFRDDIETAVGVPTLDLLGGDATGQNGGTPQHAFDLEGGWFHKGIGFRVISAYQSATTVSGSGLSQDLRFSDLFTINLRMFVNFDQKKDLVKKVPFLKGSRIAFRVNNLTNAILDVRDPTGVVPQRYQRGFLDPFGRSVEISFRKIF